MARRKRVAYMNARTKTDRRISPRSADRGDGKASPKLRKGPRASKPMKQKLSRSSPSKESATQTCALVDLVSANSTVLDLGELGYKFLEYSKNLNGALAVINGLRSTQLTKFLRRKKGSLQSLVSDLESATQSCFAARSINIEIPSTEYIRAAMDYFHSVWRNVVGSFQSPEQLVSCTLEEFEEIEALKTHVYRIRDHVEKFSARPRVPPDSQRLQELLPEVTVSHNYIVHFVNRDEAMKKLFRIHLELYNRINQVESTSGADLLYPLMDSMNGMGKTTFGLKYLALVERFVQKNGAEGLFDVPPIDMEKSGVNGLLQELRAARTLHLCFESGDLFDSATRNAFLVEKICQCAATQWKINIRVNGDSIGECIRMLPKPVFLVLDDIGTAFEKANTKMVMRRSQFLSFITSVCGTLSNTRSVYYLLSGRSHFMWNVGMRPEYPLLTRLVGSPGVFCRVNLNPIRETKIKEMLQKTIREGRPLSEHLQHRCPGKTLDEIIVGLYLLTAGHPRSLVKRVLGIQDPLCPNISSPLILDQVKICIRKFPSAVEELFRQYLKQEVVNLTSMVGENVSGEFLAIRMYAGYGDDITRTKLWISPSVERYLIWYFLPFTEFLTEYERLINLRHVARDGLYEEVLVKWFISVFGEDDRTCGENMVNFCPSNSVLHSVKFSLDQNCVHNGKQILKPGLKSQSRPTTISQEDFAGLLETYFNDGAGHVYFPGPKSNSPDIFVIPPHIGERILIGIQAKCYKSHRRITQEIVLSEAEKFHSILKLARVSGDVKAILIMCATCMYTKKHFKNISGNVRAVVWDHDKLASMNIEVLIINLSNKSLRNEFFSLAIPVRNGARAEEITGSLDSREKAIKIIEKIVKGFKE